MKFLSKLAVAVFLVAAVEPLLCAAERPIDVQRSSMTIHVGKAGVFSMAGHEHTVAAPVAEGAINDAPARIWFRIQAAKLTVAPEKDQAEVQAEMQKKVLDSEKYPEIRFESTEVKENGTGRWKVSGNLTLHGQTHQVTADVHREGSGYKGESLVKQTDFGIEPPSAAGGTVKAKNELKIEFVIEASK